MAFESFDPKKLTALKSWYKNVFLPGAQSKLSSVPYQHINPSSRSKDPLTVKSLIEASTRIFEAVTSLKFDVNMDSPIDKAFNYLSSFNYSSDSGWTELTSSDMANFIAAICKMSNVIWNDYNVTDQMLTAFTDTILGEALYKNKCFASQLNEKPAEPKPEVKPEVKPEPKPEVQAQTGNQTQNNNTGSYTTAQAQPQQPAQQAPAQQQTQTQAPTQQPQQGAKKSSGKTLNISNCGGLVSGTVEMCSGKEVLQIQGTWEDTSKKTTPRVFIMPENKKPPITVKVGSGQGFNDCVLYFFDLDTANAFLAGCAQRAQDVKATLVVRRQTADSNGYYKINTDLGEAYIKASRLN